MPKIIAIIVLLCCAAEICWADDAPPAWVNAVDTNAMERVLFDYTNNVIRSEWAGTDKSIGKELPANLGFQFAVVGDEDVTNRVNAILRATRDAMQPRVREEIEKHNYLGPTLQWLVRSTRQGVTNSTSYLKVNATKAVFEEADFNIEVLTNLASRLQPHNIPAIAAISPVYKVEPDYASILPAEPGVDYPDIMPEQTFATPYGIGMVIRAPEYDRYFRYKVLNLLNNAEAVWTSSVWVPINSYRFSREMSATKGFAEICISHRRQFRRIDIMVCQKRNDVMGPPTYISFYDSPYVVRKYDNQKRILSAAYAKSCKTTPPYDISSLWIPRSWTDEYEYRDSDIHGFIREYPITSLPMRKADEFSNRGEMVLSKDYHGDPSLIQKIKYYVESGELKYEACGDEINVKGFTPRRRGEGKVGWLE